jgi:hypothetical protein
MRYVSKFHNGSKKGDDEILNTIILNKLNIFSVKTYDDVKQFLFQILGSDQREFVREFTWLVFRKAAAEDKFCGLFAKLLSEIKGVIVYQFLLFFFFSTTVVAQWVLNSSHSDLTSLP